MNQEIESLLQRHEELAHRLSEPDVLADSAKLRELSVAFARLDEVVQAYHVWKDAEAALEGARELVGDPDLGELARAEVAQLGPEVTRLYEELRLALVPRDPTDDGNAILEIRAGTGGEEAALFGGDLLRMYQRYAAAQGWQFEMISLSETDIGGVKEAVCLVSGREVFGHCKFESGVHRVQRVPQTESGGRIHTSAATVAVLPEGGPVDVTVEPGDLRIDTFRAGGAGGQHVNKTESAVRITHLATGIVAVCQDEKSQIKNREKAMRVLMARLRDHFVGQQTAATESARRAQVGSGDRSERIRTYNFPQGRVTDHRINLTVYALPDVLQGRCELLIKPLREHERMQQLAED